LSKVKFGFCVPVLAGSGTDFRTVDYRSIKAAVVECEQLGYDSFWVADHLILGFDGSILECWTVLSALASLTEKMRLGTLVLCNSHRCPAVTAKMAATLDVISNGRLDFGIGAGWNRSEHEAYGLPWNPSGRARIEQMVEGIQIAKRMWTEEKPSFKGKYYEIRDAVCNPKPVQKPHPPIWVGGIGEKVMLRAVAKYANGWNAPPLPVKAYAHKLEVLKKNCLDVKTDFNSIEKSIEERIIIGQDKREVDETLRKENVFIPKAAIQHPKSTNEISKVYVMGTVDECIKRIAKYVNIGVTQFMFWFLDFPSMKGIRLFAEEVIPSFK